MVIVCLNKVAAYSVKMWVLVDVALVIVCRTTGNQSVVLSCSVSTHCILCACMNLLLGDYFSWHPLPLLLTVCCFTGTRMLHPESSAARNNLAWRNANQLEFFFFFLLKQNGDLYSLTFPALTQSSSNRSWFCQTRLELT